MPPRFIERMDRQSRACKDVWERQGAPIPPSPVPSSPNLSSYRSQLSSSSAASTTSSYRSQLSSSSSTTSVNTQTTTSSQRLPPPAFPPNLRSNKSQPYIREKGILPADSTVLVTGANSFQGSHVADQLLAQGYRVKGTVRDARKAAWTEKLFRKKYGSDRYTAAIVPDMSPKGVFDAVARGCSGVVHCASVMTLSTDPLQVIPATIAGAINALEAAAKASTVRRFVYTSSTEAAVASGEGTRGIISSESWNMKSFLDAWGEETDDWNRPWAVFASSKLQTEQQIWKWYSDHQPGFELNTVLPACLWGQTLNPEQQLYPRTSSLRRLRQIWDGHASDTTWAPPQYFVDVRDSALLHVAALILPDVRQRRIFAVGTPIDTNAVVRLLRMLYPRRDFPEDGADDPRTDMTIYGERREAEAWLRRMGKLDGWTDLESCLQSVCDVWAAGAAFEKKLQAMGAG